MGTVPCPHAAYVTAPQPQELPETLVPTSAGPGAARWGGTTLGEPAGTGVLLAELLPPQLSWQSPAQAPHREPGSAPSLRQSKPTQQTPPPDLRAAIPTGGFHVLPRGGCCPTAALQEEDPEQVTPLARGLFLTHLPDPAPTAQSCRPRAPARPSGKALPQREPYPGR